MKIYQRISQKLNTGKSINTEKIISQIEDYDVVSFDIFDTLLKRNVKRPTDVFYYIEKKWNKKGFGEARIKAENMAREVNQEVIQSAGIIYMW